jgi:hypothetical protein
MSDLTNILKEEYTKKKSNIDPQTLIGMVEDTLDKIYEQFARSPEPIQEMASDRAKEFLLVLPKYTPTEAWGDPNSMDRDQINKLFSVMGGGRTIEGKLGFLQRITVPDNKITSPRRIISSLIILESLKAVIHSFNAASAGFVFEGWLAALLQGVQIGDVTAKGNLPIQDLIAFASSEDEMDARSVPISLKLLNQTTNIEGSYTNLIDGLDEFGKMVYIVARKSKDDQGKEEGIAIEEFTFNQDNFIDALTLSSRGKGKASGLALFKLPKLTAEQSIARLKNADSWPERYDLLQQTAGYSARIRQKRQDALAAQAAEESSEAAQLPDAPIDAEVDLNEAIKEEWSVLNESKGGTQWTISPSQLISFNFVDYKTLGALPVSEKKILEIARMYMERLNSEVLELFTATQDLSENINKYFLVEKRKSAINSGNRAIQDSVKIQETLQAQLTEPDDENSP